MASAAKSPAPPSFYNRMASMSGPGGAPSPEPPKPETGAGGDANEIAAKLMTVVDKWSKSNKEAAPYAEKVMTVLKDYVTTVLKKKPEEMMGGDQPAPPPSPGAGGPAPGGAPPSDTQPVPA